jgi:hypothetical protein
MTLVAYKKLFLILSASSQERATEMIAQYFYHKDPVTLQETEDPTEFRAISAKGKDLNVLVKHIKGRWQARNL